MPADAINLWFNRSLMVVKSGNCQIGINQLWVIVFPKWKELTHLRFRFRYRQSL